MILLALSATFVGFIHSLSPGHWLPIVLLSKGQNWSLKQQVLGACVASLGHILISLAFGLGSIWIGETLIADYAEILEKYSAWLLISFGLGFGLQAYFRHSKCSKHAHHGPNLFGQRGSFLFLFSLGLAPCLAALPLFLASSGKSLGSLLMVVLFFSLGVISSLLGSTILVMKGLLILDHPIWEHHGDIITGAALVVTGGILLFTH